MTRLPRPRRRTAPAAALMSVVALALTSASTASADTYTVWSCRGPDGAAVPATAWQGASAHDECGADGALTARVDGPGVTGAVFVAPPGTSIAGFRANLTARTADARLLGGDAQAGIALGGPLGTPPVAFGCPSANCTFGDEQDPLGEKGAIDAEVKPGTDTLALVASCDGHVYELGCLLGGEGPAQPVALARLWRSAVDLADDEPPTIGDPSGSLLAGAVSGRATLRAAVADAGGGVAAADLLVDGAPAGSVRPGGACAEPYSAPAPCPADLPASFEVDTGGLAPGSHTALLRARDASGAETTSDPIAFTVAAPPTPTTPTTGGVESVVAPGPPQALLSATVAVERRRVAPGGTVRGTVRLSGGGPAAGAHLAVVARRFGPGDPPERQVGTATVGADGGFSVPAGRTARWLMVRLDDPAYRPAQSPSVKVAGELDISATPSRKRLRNGDLLTLRARIDGAGPGAAAERTVLVQALVGGRWSTVDSIEAGAAGRATWHYRFRRTTRPAEYRFRLRIPAGGEDWPFAATVSSVVKVAVRP